MKYDPRVQFPPLDQEGIKKVGKCYVDNNHKKATPHSRLIAYIAEAILAADVVGDTVRTVGEAWDRVTKVHTKDDPRFDVKHPQSPTLQDEFMEAAQAVLKLMK